MWWYNILDNYCNFDVSPSHSLESYTWIIEGTNFPLKVKLFVFRKVDFRFLPSFSASKLVKILCPLYPLSAMKWCTQNGHRKGGNFHISFQQIYFRSSCGPLLLFRSFGVMCSPRSVLHSNLNKANIAEFAEAKTNKALEDSSMAKLFKKQSKSRFSSGGRHVSNRLVYFFYFFCLNKFSFCFWLLFFGSCEAAPGLGNMS